jgi:hypothetical protein
LNIRTKELAKPAPPFFFSTAKHLILQDDALIFWPRLDRMQTIKATF